MAPPDAEDATPSPPRRGRWLRLHLWTRLRSAVRANEIALPLLAAAIGVVVGLGVVALREGLQLLHELLFDLPSGQRLSASIDTSPLLTVLVPVLGGLGFGAVMWLIGRWRPRPPVDPIEANALYGGRMSLRDGFVVAGATLMSSGVGASVGMEAGYTQLGGGIASRIGQIFRLRRADLRILVGCGTAAAIAAAFDAPLAGTFYAFELIMGAYTAATLAPVVAAALTATVVERLLLNEGPFLEVTWDAGLHAPDYAIFVVIGLACAGLGILMMQGVTWTEAAMRKLALPQLLRPAVGGLIVGLMALRFPEVLSSGHGALHADLTMAPPLAALALLLIAKTAAAAISLGAGFRGGLFFTSLLTGALFGGIMAQLTALALPGHPVEHLAYSLVGMASMAAAVIGGPLTMTFLALELTDDFSVAVGVMVGVVVAAAVVRHLFGYSFATWRFHLRGEAIRGAQDVGWIRDLTVARLMRRDARSVPETTTIADFRRQFPVGSTQRVFLTDGDGRAAGLALVSDVHNSDHDTDADTIEIGTLRHAAAYMLLPGQSIRTALELFHAAETESLPVVSDAQERRIIGYLSEAYSLRRYSEELERRRAEDAGERWFRSTE
ncbi:CIC family chloride channel protein [Inquilinus ginsengisoli]|uniref:CIC family chloride channel protein n=1 Tax=Inquilinus ginsengisoli TaxID=363840 RepID=A0ABU1JZ66_9PROT|nr:chloride channel protein [Inquilinus ginsengisoli]MDR6293562.1 CIC family chloride channel protein [Inquilinus ginsengisoli]